MEQKTTEKINSLYSILLEIIFEVPQRSILRALLFNIFLIDLFFIIKDKDIAGYVDDSPSYVSADNCRPPGWLYSPVRMRNSS